MTLLMQKPVPKPYDDAKLVKSISETVEKVIELESYLLTMTHDMIEMDKPKTGAITIQRDGEGRMASLKFKNVMAVVHRNAKGLVKNLTIEN